MKRKDFDDKFENILFEKKVKIYDYVDVFHIDNTSKGRTCFHNYEKKSIEYYIDGALHNPCDNFPAVRFESRQNVLRFEYYEHGLNVKKPNNPNNVINKQNENILRYTYDDIDDLNPSVVDINSDNAAVFNNTKYIPGDIKSLYFISTLKTSLVYNCPYYVTFKADGSVDTILFHNSLKFSPCKTIDKQCLFHLATVGNGMFKHISDVILKHMTDEVTENLSQNYNFYAFNRSGELVHKSILNKRNWPDKRTFAGKHVYELYSKSYKNGVVVNHMWRNADGIGPNIVDSSLPSVVVYSRKKVVNNGVTTYDDIREIYYYNENNSLSRDCNEGSAYSCYINGEELSSLYSNPGHGPERYVIMGKGTEITSVYNKIISLDPDMKNTTHEITYGFKSSDINCSFELEEIGPNKCDYIVLCKDETTSFSNDIWMFNNLPFIRKTIATPLLDCSSNTSTRVVSLVKYEYKYELQDGTYLKSKLLSTKTVKKYQLQYGNLGFNTYRIEHLVNNVLSSNRFTPTVQIFDKHTFELQREEWYSTGSLTLSYDKRNGDITNVVNYTNNLCHICQEKPSDYVNKCGHKACLSCWGKMRKCPHCNDALSDIRRIYN